MFCGVVVECFRRRGLRGWSCSQGWQREVVRVVESKEFEVGLMVLDAEDEAAKVVKGDGGLGVAGTGV